MKIKLIPADRIYMIRRKDIIDPFFFLYDGLEAPDVDIVLWTPSLVKAREFYTEESVETYLHDRLSNRPCEIVKVK